jgi:hypothetical protein
MVGTLRFAHPTIPEEGTTVFSRHCERSEAIHTFFVARWIASSLRSLAQTLRVCRRQ